MTPILEAAIAAVAAIISILSLRTQRAIKHIGVGKSFWIPVALSGILFIVGSAISALNLIGFTMVTTIPMIDEIAQTTRLIAMGFLLIGVTSYSRQVSNNLRGMPETMKLAEKNFRRTAETEPETETETEEEEAVTEAETEAEIETQPQERKPFARAEVPIQERLNEPEFKVNIPQECQHELGYLRTLSRKEGIPDECLRCTKILDCRHGFSATKEPKIAPNPPEEEAEA
jgi:hypothetical protein